MSWLVDHPEYLYIPLGIVALGFITAWWLNKRVKFLAYAGAAVLAIGAVLLVAYLLPSDTKAIHHAVQTMADAVVRGDDKELFKHVSRDFRHNNLNREQMAAVVKGIAAQHKISEVKIWQFACDPIERDKRSAKAQFNATVFDAEGKPLRFVLCLATFTLEDDQWKLRDRLP